MHFAVCTHTHAVVTYFPPKYIYLGPIYSTNKQMQHHQCFRLYITKTRATRIRVTVYFKHQYITNPTVSPESHVVAAAKQLAMTLQGNRVQATLTARQTTHLPRVEAPLPRVADPSEADCCVVPRVANGPRDNCWVVEDVLTPSTSQPVVQAPTMRFQLQPLCLSPTGCPNYISQDENDDPPTTRRTT